MNRNPFIECPIYETKTLKLEKISIEDADELFEVYSDPITKGYMNNDNCGGEWPCYTVDVVKEGICSWEQEYEDKFYVRFTIFNKELGKRIGTIEYCPFPSTTRFFDGTNEVGILRVDIKSEFNNVEILTEIFELIKSELMRDFGTIKVITKYFDKDRDRIIALKSCGFKRLIDYTIINFPNYYGLGY